MVDDDDEEIKIISNVLHIEVSPEGGEIAYLYLIKIKRNKNNKLNKQINEKYGIISEIVYTCDIHLSNLNLCKK